MRPEEKTFSPKTRFYMKKDVVRDFLGRKGVKNGWTLSIRDVTNVNNERTAIAAICPAWGMLQPLNGISVESPEVAAFVLGAVNSLTLDFVSRQRFAGRHLNVTTFSQLPCPRVVFSIEFVRSRVLELTYTSHSLAPFARDLGYNGLPFAWDEDRRANLRADLDAFYGRAYGLTRDELRYILDPADVKGPDYPSETFRVLKEKEIRHHGEYRTRRLVLAAWDRMEANGEFTAMGM